MHGIPRSLIKQGLPIVLLQGRCVGCGTGDYTQAALRDHPALPDGSLVPLCEHCEPRIIEKPDSGDLVLSMQFTALELRYRVSSLVAQRRAREGV